MTEGAQIPLNRDWVKGSWKRWEEYEFLCQTDSCNLATFTGVKAGARDGQQTTGDGGQEQSNGFP